MESVRRVRKTDLARNTRQIISAVVRGQTALIENHGAEEAAIIDIIDYRLTKAAMHYYARRPHVEKGRGLADDVIAQIADPQQCYDLVLAHYLAGSISLSRAAELLQLPTLDLHTRFIRVDIPIHSAPGDVDEALADAQTAAGWPTGSEH
jgi:predicted HTH domain antitoxin